jgi:hypothetical protein
MTVVKHSPDTLSQNIGMLSKFAMTFFYKGTKYIFQFSIIIAQSVLMEFVFFYMQGAWHSVLHT